MILYNLFPRLAGSAEEWPNHMDRARAMGFDGIYLNPLQCVGASGSLYSIADACAVDPQWGSPSSAGTPEEQVRAALGHARRRGLHIVMDLVLNHTAADAPLVRQHPEWYVWENGAPAHPGCDEPSGRVVWRDLAQLDWRDPRNSAGLQAWAGTVVDKMVSLGASGFRCDAAYQVPAGAWRAIIASARARHPDLVFAAETLGCTPAQTMETARTGFEWVFNSARWWDFESPWLMEQYGLIREVCDSIAFPESHDTPRLAEECRGWVPRLRQRYLFSALFSGGLMMPMGFEFGFRRPLHVVNSRPQDWESSVIDLSAFIRRVNEVKRACPVFQEDGPMQVLPWENPRLLVFWKSTRDGRQEAIVVLNKDDGAYQPFGVDRPARLFQGGGPLRCVSPENPLDFVPEPFEYALRPGEAIVLVTVPARI